MIPSLALFALALVGAAFCGHFVGIRRPMFAAMFGFLAVVSLAAGLGVLP